MGAIVVSAIKAIVKAVLTLLLGLGCIVVGVVGGVLGLLADAAWWAVDLSYFGKKILPVPDHPPISQGPLPITTWAIGGAVNLFKKGWDWLWGDDEPAPDH